MRKVNETQMPDYNGYQITRRDVTETRYSTINLGYGDYTKSKFYAYQNGKPVRSDTILRRLKTRIDRLSRDTK